ncbi:peptidoglycan DD-metalloendopeptidase family protein [uncultured Pseudokineococcus sp.]|uniref:peptidoglycan DD-metalloendopeptidase family protein n=1 Tax=uncultured Pseudokineococcus sp. TaxID=1642928 RepID=UPI00261F945E|nr:peptidoglycan DD-metalloendopeptidase family protein [uncultured Pseudokineococcus sp.]
MGAAGAALLVVAGTAPAARAAPDEGAVHQRPAPVAAPAATHPGTAPATSPGTPAAARPVPARAARGWEWPLPGEPAVLRPFVAPLQRWSPGHRGVDLAAGAGDLVLAPSDGVVGFAGTVVDRGVVVLEHDGDLRTTLEPVQPLLPVGAAVRRGEAVARLVGGHCPPGCLHWGVRRGRGTDAVYLDPLALLGPPAPPVLLPLAVR